MLFIVQYTTNPDGNGANIIVKKSGNFIDFTSIWKKQDLSTCMKDELLILAEKINYTITDTEENVGSYCKKRICWDNVKNLTYELSDEMKKELKDSSEHVNEKVEARVKQKSLNRINTQIEVINRGLEYWTAMYTWADKEKIFTDKEMSILGTTLRMMTNPPSEKIVMPFSMLLNLVGSSNADNKEILWKFINRFHKEIKPNDYPILDGLTEYAINYFNDKVQPNKKFKAPSQKERDALKTASNIFCATRFFHIHLQTLNLHHLDIRPESFTKFATTCKFNIFP